MNRYFGMMALLALMSCSQPKQAPETPAESTTTSITDTSSDQKAKPDTSLKADVNPSDPIASIRQKVEHINTARLEKKHFEFMCDEKMMVDYFYENGQIVKIAVDFGTVGDVYAKEGYYYDNGRLIFIYEFVEGGPACEGCIKTNEYRSYINNNKVIRYLKNKSKQKCSDCEFNDSSKEYKLLQAKTAAQMKKILCF